MKEKINVIKDNKKDSGLRFPTNTSLILFFLKGSIFYFTAGAVFACLVALFDLIIPRLIQYTVDAVIGGNLSSVPGWAARIITRLGGADYLRGHLWIMAAAVAAAALAGALSRYGFRVSNCAGPGISSSGRSCPFRMPGWGKTAREILSSAALRMSKRYGFLSLNS